jgi:hypothetical protein
MIDTYRKKHKIRVTFFKASVVELVDTTDSKSVAFGCGGSSPPTGTNIKKALTSVSAFFCLFSAHQINGHQNHEAHNRVNLLHSVSVLKLQFHQ